MRAGVIDIGSNSIKLLIGEHVDNDISVLESLKNVVPIGNSTFFREKISRETITQAINILEKYKKVLKDYEVENVSVIATTAVREARNKDVFIDTVLRKTGLKIDVLTVGDVVYYIDAYLAYKLKNKYPIHEKNVFIAELGSGSLDISIMRKGFSLMSSDLPVGTLRIRQLMNKLDGTLEEVFEAVEEYVENEFSYLDKSMPRINIDDIIVIDENHANLHNMASFKKVKSDFLQLSLKDCDKIISEVKGQRPEDFAQKFDIPIDIADTIVGYVITLKKFFSFIQNKHVYFLETSLAEAILANMLLTLDVSEKYNKTNQLIAAVGSLGHKFDLDLDHARQVAKLANMVFEGVSAQLGLTQADLLYLTLASYLHDIGNYIHTRSHQRHTEYIINALNLFRLTPQETKVIACVGRYHRRGLPSRGHGLYGALPEDKQLLVQKLASILKLADALDCSHRQKVKHLKVEAEEEGHTIFTVHTTKNFLLEKDALNLKKGLFEEITGNKVKLMIKE